MKELSLFVTKTAKELEDLERSINALRENAARALEGILAQSGSAPRANGEGSRPDEENGVKGLVDPYGTFAAEWLIPEQGRIEAMSRTMVDLFYTTLMMHPDARAVLDLLSPPELDHLKSGQVRYLATILSPDLSKPLHEKLAKETGGRHAMVGLVPSTLAEAFSLYRHELERFFSSDERRNSLLRGIIIERLANDLSWQLVAFSEIEQERARLTDEFLHLFSTAPNRRDLLKGVLDRMIQIPGVAGASVASVLDGDKIQCEVLSGLVLNGVECIRNHVPKKADKDNLARRAFEEERPILLNNLRDAPLAPAEAEEARILGIRSMAAWPLISQDGVPIDILNIYSKWPGYFHSGSQQFFWTILSRSLGSALSSLEGQPRSSGARSVSLSDNQKYRSLLQHGAVEMWYQPVVNAHTRELVKFESLARLRDGDRINAPGQFLPAFGSNQLLLLFDLGIERIRNDVTAWADIPGDFFAAPRLSINLPVEAFSSRSFMDRLQETGFSGISADCSGRPVELTLELVEAGFLDERSARSRMASLKDAGYRIALDDIGTGDSSIRRLKSLPIDEIKIDQGFVRTLDKNLDHLEFVFSLIDLASGLGIDYVLEGVETSMIYDMVAMTGGRGMLQGYAIGRPMPAGEVAAWWERWQSTPATDHPWSLPGWLVSQEIRLRYSWILCSRGAHEMIDISSLSDADRCPLSASLSALRIPDDLKRKADRLHRDFHHQIKNEVVKQRPLSHPEILSTFERVWRNYRAALIDLMPS